MIWRDADHFLLEAYQVQRQRRRQAWALWQRLSRALRLPELLP